MSDNVMREYLVEYNDGGPAEILAMTEDVAEHLRSLVHVAAVTLVE